MLSLSDPQTPHSQRDPPIFSFLTPSSVLSIDGSAPETAAGPLVGQLALNLGGAPSAPLFSSTLETKFRWSSAKVQLNELNYLNDYFKLHLALCWQGQLF